MFLITLLTSLALAQSTTSSVTNIEYEPLGVNASHQGGDKNLLHEDKRPILNSMITLRNDFHTEMLQSAALIE